MTELERLAEEYRAACTAMQPLWADLMRAYPNSDRRLEASRLYREGRERVDAAKTALLNYCGAGLAVV